MYFSASRRRSLFRAHYIGRPTALHTSCSLWFRTRKERKLICWLPRNMYVCRQLLQWVKTPIYFVDSGVSGYSWFEKCSQSYCCGFCAHKELIWRFPRLTENNSCNATFCVRGKMLVMDESFISTLSFFYALRMN